MTDKSSECLKHFLKRYIKSEVFGLPDPQKLKQGAFPLMIKRFEKPSIILTVIKSTK